MIRADSPGFDSLRQVGQATAKTLRNYDAATTSHLRRAVTDKGSGNTIVDRSRGKLRDWARHLQRNNSTAAGIIRVLSRRTMAPTVAPMVRRRDGSLHDEVNQDLWDLWERWQDNADVSGALGFEQLCQLVGESWYRDGEVFTHMIAGSSSYPYATDIPLVLETLESDFLPFDRLPIGPRILHGVEIDSNRRWAAYHFYREHPAGQVAGYGTLTRETTRVPADSVLALRLVSRLDQIRGVSVLAPVIATLEDKAEYELAERVAAKFAACVGISIERSPELQGQFDTSTKRDFTYEPGMTFEGMPGEKLVPISAERPATQFSPFLQELTRQAAVGSGTPYSSISADFSGSYSSQRQMMIEARQEESALFRIGCRAYFKPLWGAFTRACLLAGKIPNLAQIRPGSVDAAEWIQPAMLWIDPDREISALIKELDAGLESPQGAARRRGGDYRRVAREREAVGASNATDRISSAGRAG